MAKRQRMQKNDDPRLQSIWRASVGRREGIRLECQSEAEAKRLRFALYNSVRHLRELEGQTGADRQLLEAVRRCGISLIDGKILLVQDREFSPLMSSVNKALEEYGIAVKSEVSDAAAASLEKLKAMGVVVEEEKVKGAGEPLTEEEELRAKARAKANMYYGKL